MPESQPASLPRVAITGAGGFVGRHLTAKLVKARRPPVALSRADSERAPAEGVVPINDYRDACSVAETLSAVDCLVHLAARAHVLPSNADDAKRFEEANVGVSLAVARACVMAQVPRMVMLSSIGVHGSRTHGQAFVESDAPHPDETYAISKWQAEQAVADALAGTTTSLVVLRPTLVYAADAPGNFAQLLGLVRRLPLVPLGGLREMRSLMHVDNLCDAILLAAWHPGASGRRFVLCDGEDLSVADIARELAVGMGRDPRRIVDVPARWLRGLASLLGRAASVDKLAAELIVDASAYRAATGWLPPRRAREALRETGAAYLRDARRRPR